MKTLLQISINAFLRHWFKRGQKMKFWMVCPKNPLFEGFQLRFAPLLLKKYLGLFSGIGSGLVQTSYKRFGEELNAQQGN